MRYNTITINKIKQNLNHCSSSTHQHRPHHAVDRSVHTHKIRFRTVGANIVSHTFGVTRCARRMFRVGDICRSHFGHWICRWTMAHHCWHVQSISVARFLHDDRWHCICHPRFSQFTIVHWNSRCFSLFSMVNFFPIVQSFSYTRLCGRTNE